MQTSTSPKSEPEITPKRGINYHYLTFKRLVNSSTKELEDILVQGIMPDIRSLEGWEFKGCNTLNLTRLMGIRKFKKGFDREPNNLPDEIYGYNVPVEQNRTFDPHMAIPNESNPKKFGFFLVTPKRQMGADDMHHNALLLDYGRGMGNPIYEPAKLLRDYIVQVDPQNPDLFLGKAYIALGTARVFVSFFVLERYNKIGL